MNVPVVKASISDKKVSTKMEPSKDFGSFSALLAPSLLTGKTTAASIDDETSSNRMTSNKLSTSNLSTSKSSLLKSEKKDESFNYSSSFQDKYETNNNLNSTSSFAEDNNNSVNRYVAYIINIITEVFLCN